MIKDIFKYSSLQGTQNIYFKSQTMLLHVIFSPFDIIQVALHCCFTCVNLQPAILAATGVYSWKMWYGLKTYQMPTGLALTYLQLSLFVLLVVPFLHELNHSRLNPPLSNKIK